jgi:hypothetical protein
MPNHFKIHQTLASEDLLGLEEFARASAARTVDECWEWVQAHGYTIGRSSVARWKREFDLTDRFAASNETARALMDAAKAGGAVAISDAAMLQLSQMLFEQMVRLQAGEEMETKELWAISMALKNVVQGKRHVEKLKGEVAEALAAAEKEAKGGASGEAVVSKVRQILGVSA